MNEHDNQDRRQQSFVSATGTDYSRLYRCAFNFHKRHYPPQEDLQYWQDTAKDMGDVAASCGNDPFLNDMLRSIYEELEAELWRSLME